jgi:protein SCO1/2
LVFIAIVVGMFVVSVTREPQLSVEQLRERGVFILPKPRELAPLTLQDHLGDAFTRERLEGKWTFAFFGFTHCPDICPTTMSELGQVDRALTGALADGFQGILVTVDPERDTAEVLGKYATAFSDRFFGVLGSHEALASFAQQVNVAFAKMPADDGYTVDHTGNIVIFNPRGHYHGFIKLPHKAETIRLTYRSLSARF